MKTVEYSGQTWQVGDEAKFIAANFDGSVFSFEKQPTLRGGDFYSEQGMVFLGWLQTDYHLKEI